VGASVEWCSRFLSSCQPLHLLHYSEPLSVSDLADIIDEKPIAVIKFLMSDLGVMASMTQNLDPATCIAVAEGFGKIVDSDDMDEEL
jgi:Translation initiation factor IF-2, N-terminal region